MEYKLISPINPQYTPVQQILINRGFKYEDIDHYLNVSEQDNLSPLKLKNIENSVKILLKHIHDPKASIVLFTDCDFDGYASSALLLNYIYARWPSAVDKIKYVLHDSKFHGIELDKVPQGTTLVLAPDASSNQYDIHKELKERGIDVVIWDHHEAPYESPYACVVNNQLCDYPTKSLCGTAIVYKACQYIDQILEEQGFVDQFLDIVGTALVADMMDVRDFETHYLISRGLANLRNPFIKSMADKNAYSLGDEITPMGVAFYIVPLVNAITRVGTMEEKTVLFESMLEWKAYELIPSTKRGCKGKQEARIEQSLRVCANVKARQTRSQDAATELIEEKIVNENLLDHKILLIQLESAEFDRGITGLIANRIMGKYKRPTLLLIRNGNEWSGSGRGPGKCKLEDFREFCEQSGLVQYAQGHALAFGCSIPDENISKFLDYSDEQLKDVEFSPSYKVDFIYQSFDIRPEDILDIGYLKSLWGQEFEEALIAIENLTIKSDMITLMSRDKKPTLKITLPNGISCIKFKSSEEEFNNLFSGSGCVIINAIGKCNINKYNGIVSPQILIEDYEIIAKQEYYF